MKSHHGIKVALIVDSSSVSMHDYDLIKWSQNKEHIAITHLIIQKLPVKTLSRSRIMRQLRLIKEQGVVGYLEARLWRIIYLIERKIAARVHDGKRSLPCDVGKMLDGNIEVTPNISKSGLVYRYKDSDISKIRREGFDVLIRCGSGILRGEILNVCRFGILSFHHADNRINRGVPPCFWEVYYKQPQTGFIIQQLTDELDGGNILCRGSFPTQQFWHLNLESVYKRSNYYFKQLLNNIANNDALGPFEENIPYCNKLYKKPGLYAQLNYLRQTFSRRLRKKIHYQILGKRQLWGVSFSKCSWRNLAMYKAKRISNPDGRYLADPFVYSREGKDYCFVEDFDLNKGSANISVYELLDSEAVYLGEVLGEPFHMSFPYLFEYESQLYMVPETSENSDIRIYKCIDFPLKWELESVAMDNVSAADSMIFKKGDYWWLMSNINPMGHNDHCSELMIFYARNPLDGDWTPHAENPIYIDPSVARNGGLLFDGERIFRVAQVLGFAQYGAKSKILEIEKISPDEYKENLICTNEPNFFEGLRGTHHLHSNEEVTAFDFVWEQKL
jgi:hypothetical protein